MHQILFTVGNMEISSYFVLLDLGLILGLVLTYYEGKRRLGSGEMGLDLGLWTLIGGIVSGRIGYALFEWKSFSPNWARVFQIWKYPGLSFYGAFFGGLLVLIVFALFQRRSKQPHSFWELADVLVPGLALGLVFGWAGCLLFGCTYGNTGQGFGYMLLPDDSRPQVWEARFATQIAGLVQSGVLFLLYWLLRKRWPFSGAASLSFGLLYFLGQIFVESTRGDRYVRVGDFRLNQVLALALAVSCAPGLAALWWKARRAPHVVEEPEEPESAAPHEEIEQAVEAVEAEVEVALEAAEPPHGVFADGTKEIGETGQAEATESEGGTL